jgi:2',3'-cyclic-nucleotide 2'-phosphodiesterase (5'-nucleotidase family)
VALTTVDTPDISKPEKTTVFGRVDDVQTTVDALLAGKLGGEQGKKVKRVIAMTHIGYEEDIRLAKNTR